MIREGFSFWSFVFGFIWALFHRCWVLAAALFMGEIVLHGLLLFLNANFLTVLTCQTGLSILIGFQSNDWRRAALSQACWTLDSIVAAVDSDAAFLKWMKSKKPNFDGESFFSATNYTGNNQ